jgi:predicted transposase YbfD/YdcC
VIQTNYTTLAEHLQGISDPRNRRGRWHEWQYLLLVIASALMAGQRSGRAMAQWAAEHGEELIKCLQPYRQRIPSAATLYRVLAQVPIEELEMCISAYTGQVDEVDAMMGRIETAQGEMLRGQALDGKTVRGASQHGDLVHLVSLVRHESGIALAQERVESKIDERKAARHLLTAEHLSHTITTGDALYTQVKQVEQILAGGGHYLMTVKRNQPSLFEAIELAFTALPPINRAEAAFWQHQTHTTYDKQHGRLEKRTLESTPALNEYLQWPGVAQVLRRTCQRTHIKTGKTTTRVRYAITSLSRKLVSLDQLESVWRRHWTIENQLHHVRDVSFGEDACQIHSGHAPQALAALRNAILALLRFEGWSSPPTAFRHFDAHPQLALRLLGAFAS